MQDAVENFSSLSDFIAAARRLYLHGPPDYFDGYLDDVKPEFFMELSLPKMRPEAPLHPLEDFYTGTCTQKYFEEKISFLT